jgi:hypothetical protein
MKEVQKSKRLTAGDTTFYQFDSQIGFWGIPLLQHYVTYDMQPDKPIYASHNSHGNRDIERVHAHQEKSIVCFGGSHTWGAGVEQTLRYTDILAEKTGRNVVNLGHCSLGLDQICLAILHKSMHYKPEIIIVEQYPWAVHRILNNYVNAYVKPYFFLNSRQELLLQKVPPLAKYALSRRIIGSYYAFRKEFREYQSGLNIKHNYNPLTDPLFLYWKARQYDYMYSLTDKILMVIKDFCQQKNIKLLFALGAIQQQFEFNRDSELIDYDLPRKRFIELLQKNNISYTDLTTPMLTAHTKQEPVIFPDGHINSKGHNVFSEVLFENLMTTKWI